MKLYSYVVARDYGFAPNPFYGVCSLACCKPNVRKLAEVGDWVLGTGSAANKRSGYVVYAMLITEIMTFNDYWNDARFQAKKPNLISSKKQAYGDNIYYQNPETGAWSQSNSHHSYADGSVNIANLNKDTKTSRVLLSKEYIYWGGDGPQIPQKFRDYQGEDICLIRGYKSNFSSKLVTEFIAWIRSFNEHGYYGNPIDWMKASS